VAYQTTDEVNNLQIIYVVPSNQLHLTEAKPCLEVNSHSWNALQHDRVVEFHPSTRASLYADRTASLKVDSRRTIFLTTSHSGEYEARSLVTALYPAARCS
jgi:hypothetical protein